MVHWITPNIAIALMYLGVIPSIVTCALLWEDRHKPGVIWFIYSMATGGVWAFSFATFTLVEDPGVTLALANVFWVMVPTAAATLFLLAYEFVFKQNVSRGVAVATFLPIATLFVLSWWNPYELVFTPAYHVGPDGTLYFPNFGGPLKILVTKVYGYLLVFFAAGMFIGELFRTEGIHRRQTAYLLFVFSILVGSTMVKVAGVVPVYFDPTSVVYSLSGVLFAVSIRRHGLMKFVPIAREQTFQEVTDAILVVDPERVVVDVNETAKGIFEAGLIGKRIETVVSEHAFAPERPSGDLFELHRDGETRYFSVKSSPIAYGRGLEGHIVVLSDVTQLKNQEKELDLLKQVLSRVFRHNIRNDLNVIAGYAGFIKDASDREVAEWASTIEERSTKIVNQAKKAGELEAVFSYDETVERSILEYVTRVRDGATPGQFTGVTFQVDDVVVESHPRFDLALRELIENALKHHTGDDRAMVAVTSSCTDTSAFITVEDNGPGLPQNELEVLEAREETDLEHGSGVGLWLVHWIVTKSHGELTTEVSDSGTRVTIQIPLARSGDDQTAST